MAFSFLHRIVWSSYALGIFHCHAGLLTKWFGGLSLLFSGSSNNGRCVPRCFFFDHHSMNPCSLDKWPGACLFIVLLPYGSCSLHSSMLKGVTHCQLPKEKNRGRQEQTFCSSDDRMGKHGWYIRMVGFVRVLPLSLITRLCPFLRINLWLIDIVATSYKDFHW